MGHDFVVLAPRLDDPLGLAPLYVDPDALQVGQVFAEGLGLGPVDAGEAQVGLHAVGDTLAPPEDVGLDRRGQKTQPPILGGVDRPEGQPALGAAALERQEALIGKPLVHVDDPVPRATEPVIGHQQAHAISRAGLQQHREHLVELGVDLVDRVGHAVARRPAVERAVRVGEAPEVMPDQVGLAEQHHEDVPRLAFEQIPRRLALHLQRREDQVEGFLVAILAHQRHDVSRGDVGADVLPDLVE